MEPTRRERQREATREEIKALARQQMQAEGTAGISLRGIARAMGVTVTALYRYFASRDDLITALILDGFNAQADALEAAAATYPATDPAGQLYAALKTYREWALAHPIDYQLLYGNPIPGYHAPAELTVPAASRNMTVFLRLLVNARDHGLITESPAFDIPPAIAAHMHSLGEADPNVLMWGVIGWTRLQGMIMLELFEHTPPVIGDPEAFYLHQIAELMRAGGLSPPE